MPILGYCPSGCALASRTATQELLKQACCFHRISPQLAHVSDKTFHLRLASAAVHRHWTCNRWENSRQLAVTQGPKQPTCAHGILGSLYKAVNNPGQLVLAELTRNWVVHHLAQLGCIDLSLGDGDGRRTRRSSATRLIICRHTLELKAPGPTWSGWLGKD